PDARFDAGGRDCGDGLLPALRKHLAPLDRGQLLELLSTDPTVAEDLPGWCRMTGNSLVSAVRTDGRQSYMICKGALTERHGRRRPALPRPRGLKTPPTAAGAALPEPAAAPPSPTRGRPSRSCGRSACRWRRSASRSCSASCGGPGHSPATSWPSPAR